jgi:hypothetical protein
MPDVLTVTNAGDIKCTSLPDRYHAWGRRGPHTEHESQRVTLHSTPVDAYINKTNYMELYPREAASCASPLELRHS